MRTEVCETNLTLKMDLNLIYSSMRLWSGRDLNIATVWGQMFIDFTRV